MEQKDQTANQQKESVLVRKVWLSPLFYIYFLSVLTGLGMLYIHRENMVNRNSISPDLAIDSTFWNPVGDVPPGPANTGEKIDVAMLLQPTKAQIARGEQLFKVNCSSCHGTDGKGDGPASANLNPKPRDFHSTAGWKNGRLLSQMFKTVAEGIPGSAMVSFSATFPASDRLAIIDYIRTSFGDFPKDTPEQLETMGKTYHLGEVQTAPTRISVSEAMSRIEEGAIPLVRTTAAISAYISQHPTDEGSRIFDNVVIDRQRALTMLASSNFWSKNESDFVMIVTANAVQNGFDPKVARLSTQDWETLFNYLKGLFSSKDLASNNG
ncbi:MAG TPA: cytochrome c [Candidatus Acidoferrales bacterium]|nr:cytochrome c [Candidatus Acidoferrales bacterium]